MIAWTKRLTAEPRILFDGRENNPVEDEQGPLAGGPEVGDIYSVGTDFCFRMPALRRLDEEVDEQIVRGTSACASEKKSVRGAAAAAVLPVKQVTAEVRRVTLKRSSVSLENMSLMSQSFFNRTHLFLRILLNSDHQC